MAGCGRGSRGSGRRLEILDEEGAGVPGELGPAVAAEGLPVGPGALLEPGDLAYGFLAAVEVDVADHEGLAGGAGLASDPAGVGLK